MFLQVTCDADNLAVLEWKEGNEPYCTQYDFLQDRLSVTKVENAIEIFSCVSLAIYMNDNRIFYKSGPARFVMDDSTPTSFKF